MYSEKEELLRVREKMKRSLTNKKVEKESHNSQDPGYY